jgi:very-short-patch-repair endonuclease
MAALLEEAGVSYEPQVRFGRYVADFWLPATNEVIEVDGVYWHPDGPDEERDQYLLSNGVSRVSHITDMQLKAASSFEEVMPYVRGI